MPETIGPPAPQATSIDILNTDPINVAAERRALGRDQPPRLAWVTPVFPVFDIRLSDRSIIVDAALDRIAVIRYYGSMAGVAYSKARYDSIQLALRDADAIVLTH